MGKALGSACVLELSTLELDTGCSVSLELGGGGISGPVVGELVSSEQDRSAAAIKAMHAIWNLEIVIKSFWLI